MKTLCASSFIFWHFLSLMLPALSTRRRLFSMLTETYTYPLDASAGVLSPNLCRDGSTCDLFGIGDEPLSKTLEPPTTQHKYQCTPKTRSFKPRQKFFHSKSLSRMKLIPSLPFPPPRFDRPRSSIPRSAFRWPPRSRAHKRILPGRVRLPRLLHNIEMATFSEIHGAVTRATEVLRACCWVVGGVCDAKQAPSTSKPRPCHALGLSPSFRPRLSLCSLFSQPYFLPWVQDLTRLEMEIR